MTRRRTERMRRRRNRDRRHRHTRIALWVERYHGVTIVGLKAYHRRWTYKVPANLESSGLVRFKPGLMVVKHPVRVEFTGPLVPKPMPEDPPWY